MPIVRRPDLIPSRMGRTRVPASMIRLGVVCVFIGVIGMIPARITPQDAGRIVLWCGIITLLAALAFLGATRRAARRLEEITGAGPTVEAARVVVRRLGLPLLALAFFVLWTFVNVGLWWYRPEGAFTGLAPHPHFSDFFYYSVSTAFAAPPGDIVATSRGARVSTMIEMLTGFALLTAWLASMFEWRRDDPEQKPVDGRPPPA